MKVPIFKLDFEDSFVEAYQKGVKDIFSSDSISEGNYVNKFETAFSKLVNSKHSIAVTSGTSALETALRAVDVSGKKVIVPSNTFFATTVAITNSLGLIEFVDIESETLSICPDDLHSKINKNTGAVVLVHIGGIISKEIDKIISICNEYNVPLIEDAAHAHGSFVGDKYAGTIGAIGCFSFFPTKVMTTGEGGMITTNDDVLSDLCMSLKNFGRDNKNINNCINLSGSNYKINEFTGLMGYLETLRVKDRVAKRNTLIQRYKANLRDTNYELVEQKEGYCSYYKCILKIPSGREKLRVFCKDKGVSLTGEVYNLPVHKQPIYRKDHGDLFLETTEHFCQNHICPPLYPELSLEEIDYVCDVLKEAEKI